MIEIDQQFAKVTLTDRERDILRLLTDGFTDSEIAQTLILTVGTVKWYNRQIYSKLGVRNRTEAIARTHRFNLLTSKPHLAAPTPPSSPIHNLPAQITSFIGRSRELAELKASLLVSRLVTLTGPPGTGKTRLALEVASALLEHYQDAVYFVPLASMQDTSLLVQTIASEINIKQTGGDSVFDSLKANLHSRHILLVLDNFEHLLAGAPLISELLTTAPRLTVLVTSRESLRLYGEQEFPVPPLQLPDLKQKVELAALKSYEAIELFIQRAHTTQPTFAVNDDNAASIASICVHLDGLPLAIELAAARMKFYAPQTLLLRLGSRLEALGEGSRDLPARQRTLRATLAWSYDLLTLEEQILFARLGIFAGAFNTADAEAVCGDGLSIGVESGLESLLNKSLLQQIPNVAGEPHFMMLETIREYALEKLDESNELATMHEQHTLYFLALSEQASREMYGSCEAEWFAKLQTQQDNFRAAIQWASTIDDKGQTSLHFVGRLAYFWATRGHLSEGRAWLSNALRLNGAGTPTKARARALEGAGSIAYLQCDYPAARAFYVEALDIYRQIGDQRGIAQSLTGLGDTETSVGNYDSAEPMLQQAAEIMQRLGDIGGSATALSFLGWCVLRRWGDNPQVTVWFEQALALYQQEDNIAGIALVYSGLGEIALRQDELPQAVHLLEQSLALRQSLGHKWGIAATLGSLAWVEQRRGDLERATALLGESLSIRKEINDSGGIAWCLEKLAEIAHIRNDDGRAARLYGAAAALRATINSVIDPTDQPDYSRTIARIRTRLGSDVYEAVWAEGQATPLENLMEYLSLSTLASPD